MILGSSKESISPSGSSEIFCARIKSMHTELSSSSKELSSLFANEISS